MIKRNKRFNSFPDECIKRRFPYTIDKENSTVGLELKRIVNISSYGGGFPFAANAGGLHCVISSSLYSMRKIIQFWPLIVGIVSIGVMFVEAFIFSN